MNTTSSSLLDRLKCAKPDAAEWHKLQDIYLPLIRCCAIDGRPAATVARELGMSECAVMQVKFRVLKRLREEAGDFMD